MIDPFIISSSRPACPPARLHLPVPAWQAASLPACPKSKVLTAITNKDRHIPFRNSKLTHLLQPYLSGGHAKTLMLVNVAPELSNAHESLCALRFAQEVNQCDTGGKPKKEDRPRPVVRDTKPPTGGAAASSSAAPPTKRPASAAPATGASSARKR